MTAMVFKMTEEKAVEIEIPSDFFEEMIEDYLSDIADITEDYEIIMMTPKRGHQIDSPKKREGPCF